MMALNDTVFATDDEFEKKYSKSISLEHRKKYAQFFTPFPIASLMVDWLLGNQNLESVLDPAFGLGIFSRAILNKKPDLAIKGFEIDATICTNAKNIFKDISQVTISSKDYMFNDWK